MPDESGSDGTEEQEQPHEVEGTVPSQWWLDLKVENQELRSENARLQAMVRALQDDRMRAAKAALGDEQTT